MFHKLLITVFFLLLVCPGIGQASPTSLVGLDLSLVGYQLGMSYDDVAKVRPFHYESAVTNNTGQTSTFYALADHVYVDGVAMSLRVSFKNEKAYKIVARVSPHWFENVLWSIQQTMGPGENKSRAFRNYNDKEIYQSIYRWGFPSAEMHLVGVSSNTEFATISLVAK
jgi:hypothetical protein